ncbi:MAG: type II secretion system minor pseudopilin GspK [Proteobacteria bacterium]|nr:type II secretion system minor pseudopilin GspK [Pseudomonadota bacterium]MCG2745307.1 type II secretion system minor pseudopilin GspK [Desulfobacteraceae bacterium]MBU4042738.1 type II secretion system minor pseudopilin GspK [Pseudomonadota bacterium]MBU4084307.1 type II secretion system minor pseudopilin GspK [Pseudomonadota bacterium]MBU4108439.1 type II secretion system minor pseudopilin GspK [Pseudomonadota bacterium]
MIRNGIVISQRLLKNNRGMALLIALTVISLIVALTIQFNKNMRQSLQTSGIQSNSIRLEAMARSGINLAMAVLDKDAQENAHDSFQDSWALLADEDLSQLFNDGTLKVEITDNSGKFQINSVVQSKGQQQLGVSPAQASQQEEDARNILWRLLRQEPFNLEDSAARTIIDSLIDWIDAEDGDGEQEFGAESSYYQSLDTPYPCKNGPVEFIEELLLVKGVTPELLFGTEKHSGLAPLLTTQGNSGQININTADPLLLQALNEDMTKEMAEDMQTYRDDENNKDKLASTTWVSEVLPSFTGKNTLKNIIVKSNYFTISSHAQLDSTKKDIVAIVQRDNQKTTLLSWKVE